MPAVIQPGVALSSVSVATCEQEVSVAAAPITGPARMSTESSTSRLTVLPMVLVTETVLAPALTALWMAGRASAVSPLWVTAPTSVRHGSWPPSNSYSLATSAEKRMSALVSASYRA